MVPMFAVKRKEDNEAVNPFTISLSERGAKVLWLESQGLVIKNSATDSHIELWFSNMARINKVEVVEIEINIKDNKGQDR